LDKEEAAQIWETIDWTAVERFVNKIQTRIAKATIADNKKLVKELQRMLTHSYYAKLWAVKKVTTNKGKRTPGVDEVKWETSKEKYKAAAIITTKNYKPKPLKRIYLVKPNGKKRPLGIPCMFDRAIQTIEQMALDPVIESKSDKKSFGFRKSRSCADAREQLFINLSQKTSPEWILEGDIKACFDEISHNWLIKNTPMDKEILKKLLESGYMYKKELFPTISGAPQGGTISPTLANNTLNGIEKLLKDNIRVSRKINNREHTKVHSTRYADDLVVTAANEDRAMKAKELIREFIEARGLKLSEEKTLITHISDGFDFLGWNFRKYKGKLLIKPSKKSIKNVVTNLRKIINENKSSKQEILIIKLNQVLSGWSNYHQGAVSKKVFQKVSHTLFIMLWKWAVRRHPKKGKKWIKNRYWKTEGKRDWIFKGKESKLINIGDIKIIRHIRLKLDKNPYIDKKYFEERKLKLAANRMSGKFKKIWIDQKGLCIHCDAEMESYKKRTLIITSNKIINEIDQMKFIHKACISKMRIENAGKVSIKPYFTEA
jgi:RNA-directed DNA polymerase